MSVPLLTVAPITVKLTCRNDECRYVHDPRFATAERFTGRLFLHDDAELDCPSCGVEMELEES